jgi:hypothetical protein
MFAKWKPKSDVIGRTLNVSTESPIAVNVTFLRSDFPRLDHLILSSTKSSPLLLPHTAFPLIESPIGSLSLHAMLLVLHAVALSAGLILPHEERAFLSFMREHALLYVGSDYHFRLGTSSPCSASPSSSTPRATLRRPP